MKLYSRVGPQTVSNEEVDGSPFETGADDAVIFPDEFGTYLHKTHIGGRPAWEDDRERNVRMVGEEASRRADPATLLAAVEKLQSNSKSASHLGPLTSADLIALSAARKAAAAAQDEADALAIEEMVAAEQAELVKVDKEPVDEKPAGKKVVEQKPTEDTGGTYDGLTKAELQKLADKKGVDKRQNKDALIADLIKADTASE